jgi:hypothetical protein
LNEILQSTDWYKLDLKPGDKIIYLNGKSTAMRASSGSGGSGSTSGDLNGSNFSQGDGVWDLGHNDWHCGIVYTNSGGGWVPQFSCY